MMKIAGMQKTSLLDFPDKLCSTIFTDGCNLRCPFCQNASLVLESGTNPMIFEQEIFTFLNKRRGLLDGVCITGGEPLLQEGVEEFISKIKELGFLVKLDTNGTFPEQLMELTKKGLIDYVAMDIKNSLKNYHKSVGFCDFDTSKVERSVAFLKEAGIPYEFRTTVVKEFHTKKDFELIGTWLTKTEHYFLQEFKLSDDVINPNLHACSREEMEEFRNILLKHAINAQLRGMD
ncbi:MAG: anaerobic ribonucleoside-triphosphate reductase activating protein [Velocimicrobium sp.]